MLYLFTIENLSQFAVLKALGATNLRIVSIMLLQAMLLGAMGFGIGVGMAAGFGRFAQTHARLAFYMPWQVLAGTALSVMLIVIIASFFSLRRVLLLDPVVVFANAR